MSLFRKAKPPEEIQWVVHIEKSAFYRVWVHRKGENEEYWNGLRTTLTETRWGANRWARKTVRQLEKHVPDGCDHERYEL